MEQKKDTKQCSSSQNTNLGKEATKTDAMTQQAKNESIRLEENFNTSPILLNNENKNTFESNKKYFTICIYSLFVIFLGAIIIYCVMNVEEAKMVLNKIIQTLNPFIVAFFIAYLLNPIVKKIDLFLLQKCFHMKSSRLRKFLSIFLSYILVISIITVGLYYMIPQLNESIVKLKDQLTLMYNTILKFLTDIETSFPQLDISWLEIKLKEFFPDLLSYGSNFVSNIIPLLYTLPVSIARLLINILLSIVISCYMLSDKYNLAHNATRVIYSILPVKKAKEFCETAKECNNIFSRFISGKSLDSLIIGIICFIIMTIFRFDYAILLSLIVGITNMIPYFGPFIGAIPGVLIYLFTDPLRSLFYAILILILQQFDGLYLGPKILGESTGLKPLWVIFAITIGGAYFGILGMFLGVPIVAVIAYLLNRLITRRLKEKPDCPMK